MIVKCKTITWVNYIPPLREIELEESEAERLASLGYLHIIREKKEIPIVKETQIFGYADAQGAEDAAMPVTTATTDEVQPAEKKKRIPTRKKKQ